MTTSPSDPLRVVLVGVGKFGRHYANRLQQHDKVELVGVVDKDVSKIKSLRMEGITVASSLTPVAEFSDFDAVIVATSADQHVTVSMEALAYGKHVLCAKPGVTSVAEYETIRSMAKKNDADYSVDYTMISAPEVGFLDMSFCAHGEPRYMEAARYVTGPPEPVNEVWGLMCHDVALFDYHMPIRKQITHVHCWRDHQRLVRATLVSHDTNVAHFKASYGQRANKRFVAFELAPEKKFKHPVRSITWDQINRSLEFVADHHANYKVEFEEWPDPITLSINRFVRRIRQREERTSPVFDNLALYSTYVGDGPVRNVTRILEAIDKSLSMDGEKVCL